MWCPPRASGLLSRRLLLGIFLWKKVVILRSEELETLSYFLNLENLDESTKNEMINQYIFGDEVIKKNILEQIEDIKNN